MNGRGLRVAAALVVTLVFVTAWAFPIVWSVLNSFKTEQDILAYPPKLIFAPTLAAYNDVLFGSASILPNLWSSFVISIGMSITCTMSGSSSRSAALRASRSAGIGSRPTI